MWPHNSGYRAFMTAEPTNDQVRCNQCGHLLEERSDVLPEDRQPCPECGSLSRFFTRTLTGSVGQKSSLGVTAKSPPGTRRDQSGRRIFFESVTGDSFYRATGEWRRLEQAVDRAKDWYTERVLTPVGELLRWREHPLHEHSGHGTAKQYAGEDPVIVRTEADWLSVQPPIEGHWQASFGDGVYAVRCSDCPAVWAGVDGLGAQAIGEIRRHASGHQGAGT
jgi:phage FluMu protein Com